MRTTTTRYGRCYRRLARQAYAMGDVASARIYARQAREGEALRYAWVKGQQMPDGRRFRWKNDETGQTRVQISEPGTSGRGGGGGGGKKKEEGQQQQQPQPQGGQDAAGGSPTQQPQPQPQRAAPAAGSRAATRIFRENAAFLGDAARGDLDAAGIYADWLEDQGKGPAARKVRRLIQETAAGATVWSSDGTAEIPKLQYVMREQLREAAMNLAYTTGRRELVMFIAGLPGNSTRPYELAHHQRITLDPEKERDLRLGACLEALGLPVSYDSAVARRGRRGGFRNYGDLGTDTQGRR